ncbi:hypothetical protein Q7P37_008537 [Cladosporium fusiforme]
MATPARTTRARSRQATTPAPLPAVDVRQSHAYGSRGRANLRGQLAGEGATFVEAFTTGRSGAGSVPVLEESLVDEEELLPAQPPASRQGTVVDSIAHYEGTNISARSGSMPPPPRPTAAASRFPPAATTTTAAEDSNPWTLSVLLFAIPRYLWRNLWALLLGAFICSSWAVMPLPDKLGAKRDRIIRGFKLQWDVPGYDQPPGELEKLWILTRHNSSLLSMDMPPITEPALQQLVNIRLFGRQEDLDRNYTALAERITGMEEYIPRRMVVDIVDGEMSIREGFWLALREKLSGSPEMYDAFIAANEEIAARRTANAVNESLESAISSERLLTREETVKLLEEESRHLEKRLVEMVQSKNDDAASIARAVATQVATQVATEGKPTSFDAQLKLLVNAHMLSATYVALTSVNHFSPLLGAIVDPHHTSPTAPLKRKAPKVGWFSKSLQRSPNPPVAALTHWNEMGDCWCAAQSPEMGHAQLAVITEHKIVPENFIIEHVPAVGRLGLTSAPKSFELWAETPSAQDAAEVKAAIRKWVGPSSHWATCNDYDDLLGPTNTSVCIASGGYNAEDETWVKTYAMIANMGALDFAANKFYYRVNNNWGAVNTCTYRVRLTGRDTELDLYG